MPVWVAQRLWLGHASCSPPALGVLVPRARSVGVHGARADLAAGTLAYMLSARTVLQYAGRISVILLPWAGAAVDGGPRPIVALRRSGWREPALFAVVVATVSGINASSIIYVGVAPVLWLFYAVVVLRESTWRHALATGLRITVLTLGACLWWIAGLQVKAAYGVNVLKFTETVPWTRRRPTRRTSSVAWATGTSTAQTTPGPGRTPPFGSPRTSPIGHLLRRCRWPRVVAAAFVRWRERAYFLILLFVGLVLSGRPFPFSNPTVIGGELKSFMTNTTAGLALRSTDRATPLVLLALFMLLGSGLTALWSRLSVVGLTTSVLVAGLVVVNIPSLFLGNTIANYFTQPATLPVYQVAAIAIQRDHPGTRVFAIPGNNFAAYRWGDTVDTPQPALLTRDFVTREQRHHGLHRHGRHALCDGRTDSGRHRQPERTGTHGPADGRRRPHGRVRPAIRALRDPAAAAGARRLSALAAGACGVRSWRHRRRRERHGRIELARSEQPR